MPGKKPSVYVGDQYLCRDGVVTVIEYHKCDNVKVRFDDGTVVKVQVHQLKEGTVTNPNKVTIFGLGYIGQGPHKGYPNYKPHTVWRNMLDRCYSKEAQEKHPTYRGCSVTDDWLCLQNFANWYEQNFSGERVDWELDKDILTKGNKVYSPTNCVAVPQEINCLFTSSKASRGPWPVGVTRLVKRGRERFVARCNVHGESRYLGSFKTPNDAFTAYKEFKERHVKIVAEIWRSKIDTRLYNAMLKYEVLEDD